MERVRNNDVNDITKWSSHNYFLMSLICWTVGLINCWRFPIVATREGGGVAFLLPCFCMTLFVSIPLAYVEIAVGQYSGHGPVAIWKMCPLWRGAGWACVIVLYFVILYYVIVCSYLLFFCVSSLQRVLPWSVCDPAWAKSNCYTFATNRSVRHACIEKHGNKTCNEMNWQNSATHFWYERLLQRASTQNFGHICWELLLCNTFSLCVSFLCLRRGTKSLEKLLPFFVIVPYVQLAVLLFVSLIHPGSVRGLQELFLPNFSKLKSFRIWRIAFEQTMVSVGIGLGGLTMLGSQSGFRSAAHMEAIIINVVDLTSSLLFTILSFNALGALSYDLNIPMNEIMEWKDILLFVRLPLALLVWHGTTQLWTLLFFSNVYIMGLRALVFMLATVLSAIYDTWPNTLTFSTFTSAAVCLSVLICGLPYTTQFGSTILNFSDDALAGCILLSVILLQMFGITCLYGLNNFINDLHFMLGFRTTTFWQCCWLLCPFVLVVMFGHSVYEWYGNIDEMSVSLWLKVCLLVKAIAPFVAVILFLLIHVVKTPDKKISKLLKSKSDWGPKDPTLRKSRDMFSSHCMTKEYMYRQNRLRSKKFLPEVPVHIEGANMHSSSTSLY